MADDTLYRDIKIAYADLHESGEDMDVRRPGVKIVLGYRTPEKEQVAMLELYRGKSKIVEKSWPIVTDAYNNLSDVLDKLVPLVEDAMKNPARRTM